MSEQREEAPATVETEVDTSEDFDSNFKAFLGHTFDQDGDDDVIEGESTVQGTDTQAAPAGSEGTDTLVGGTGNDTVTASEIQPNAETPAGADAIKAAPSTPEVSPADLAAVLGVESIREPASGGETPKDPSQAAEDEPFMPFDANFKMAPALVKSLFEAEDTETRERAMVTVLASFGNALCQVMDQRFKEYHAPRVVDEAAGRFGEVQVRKAVHTDFYGEFPELEPFKDAVVRAFKLHQAKNPSAPYTPEVRNAIGELTRQAITSAGIALPERKGKAASPPPPPPAAAVRAKPSKAPGSAFEAGAGRPGSVTTTPADSPAGLVEQLSEF